MSAEELRILSIDHRMPLIDLATELRQPLERLAHFKSLVVDAALRVSKGAGGFGVFMDGGYGAAALAKARRAGLWAARPIDKPHARPLEFEGDDLDRNLAEWPDGVVVKCAVYLHPGDSSDILFGADRALAKLYAACARYKRQLLLEVLASPHGAVDEDTIADLMTRFYRLGVRPLWWLIEDQPGDGWRKVGDIARAQDDACAGFLTIARTGADFSGVVATARSQPLAKGFCAGRSMFGETIGPWLRNEIGDEAAIAAIAGRFADVVAAWDAPRAHPPA